MVLKSINLMKLSIILISFTYFAMWITNIISTLLSYPLVSVGMTDLFAFILLYLFSLALPAIGLLIFMKHTKENSTRWYWGIPLLIGIFLITFYRDNTLMPVLYSESFIASFDIWNILDPRPIIYLIIIFLSLASAMFCLSVPEEKRNNMKLPLMISIFAAIFIIIFSIISLIEASTYNSFFPNSLFYINAYFYAAHAILILILGLSFVRVAIKYNQN
ncbi:hypothetical protein [uncultured Methanolobus sp.]|uniref:hypothetical protein n=1 Tax=uncultured Methanolobus sp. TaxID=218300 RepID=UPI002AAC19AC|nr:hypothetical protein [uncultured Methanolobus sp.]